MKSPISFAVTAQLICAFVFAYTKTVFLITPLILERRAAAVDDFVAFSAGLSQTTSLSGNSSLAFDRVWLNLDDGYDNSTGEFTCPRAGTYVFMFNGLANSVSNVSVLLIRKHDHAIYSNISRL